MVIIYYHVYIKYGKYIYKLNMVYITYILYITYIKYGKYICKNAFVLMRYMLICLWVEFMMSAINFQMI